MDTKIEVSDQMKLISLRLNENNHRQFFKRLGPCTLLALVVGLLSVTSCSTSEPSHIVIRQSDNRAIVYAKDNDFRKGDRLDLFDGRCRARKLPRKCEASLTGTATVTEQINERYSRVLLDQTTKIYEGQPVQKHIE
jgi:hypothetical protein